RVPLVHVHTHAPAVVGPFPRLHNGLAAGRHAAGVHRPEPLAAGALVHQLVGDVVPDVRGGGSVGFAAGFLVFVHKAQHRLGLDPPDPGGVVHPALALVEQGVVPVGVLVHAAGQVRVDGPDPGRQGRIAQQGAAPVDQPAGLDVVAVAVQVDDGAVVAVEKDQLPVQRGGVDLVGVDPQDAPHGLAHGGVAAGLVQAGVPFKDVEQGVH